MFTATDCVVLNVTFVLHSLMDDLPICSHVVDS